MKRDHKKKLTLNKETLRVLSSQAVHQAAAFPKPTQCGTGAPATWCCPPTLNCLDTSICP
jgi:hypothetical protein